MASPSVPNGTTGAASCAAIDGVRLAYATASAVVLGPQENDELAANRRQRPDATAWTPRWSGCLIEYHEQRSCTRR